MQTGESRLIAAGGFPFFLNSETYFPHLVVNESKTAIEHASDDLPPWQRPRVLDAKTRAAGEHE